jgi:hypothetical protein
MNPVGLPFVRRQPTEDRVAVGEQARRAVVVDDLEEPGDLLPQGW